MILASGVGGEVSLNKLAIYFQRPISAIAKKLIELREQLGSEVALSENGPNIQSIIDRYSLEDSFAIAASLGVNGQVASSSEIASKLNADIEGTRDHVRDLLADYKSSLKPDTKFKGSNEALQFLEMRKKQLNEQLK